MIRAILSRIATRFCPDMESHGQDAATLAFDEIARICGCAEWHCPGQVVRDVEALRARAEALTAERDALRLELDTSVKNIAVPADQGIDADDFVRTFAGHAIFDAGRASRDAEFATLRLEMDTARGLLGAKPGETTHEAAGRVAGDADGYRRAMENLRRQYGVPVSP